MRKWRNCTFLHFPALHSLYSGTSRLHRCQGWNPSQGWALPLFRCKKHSRVLSRAAFSIQHSDGQNRRGSRFRGSSSSARRHRHESSIARNYFEIVAKNCFPSSSTWTSGVHRDNESLRIAKVQKPDWYTSARAHDATAEFPQILARGSELKGECDESGSIIIHRMHGSAPGTHM